jgi:hypothetical protein
MQARQCRGLMTALRPAACALSPACGLFALSTPTFASNAYSVMLPPGHLHLLCKELFYKPSDSAPLRVAASRSRAAAHLSPEILGHVVGLAATGACPSAVKDCLGSLGIATNKIHGSWTGVSMARWQRLVQLVGGVVCGEQGQVTGGTALLMRFLWEKARCKADILSFLLALHAHTPVLQPALAADPSQHRQWLMQSFSAAEIEDDDTLVEAAIQLLDPSTPDVQFAHHYELLAAGISAVQAFRTPIRLERHRYKEGKEVPDCVEVVVREIIELLIFDHHQRGFDTSRLPSTADPSLAAFFSSDFASSRAAAEAW